MSDEQTTVATEGLDSTPAPVATPEPTPAPVTEPQEQPAQIIKELTVHLPGSEKDYVVKKLKSGAYYEAQKLYAAWVSELMAIAMKSQEKLGSAVDADGKVDAEKVMANIDDEKRQSLMTLLDATADASATRFKLIAKCLEVDEKAVQDTFYPEDMDELFSAVCKVNNFAANLKKSVTPSFSLVA